MMKDTSVNMIRYGITDHDELLTFGRQRGDNV